MFVSWQTYGGFQIGVHSAIEATKFLAWNLFLPSDFAKTHLKSTFAVKGNLANEMLIQISKHLGATITLSEFSEQCPAKVETLEGETTKGEAGSKLSMARYIAERTQN